MAKNKQVEQEEVLDVKKAFEAGDYFSASVKVQGKRDLVKVRGIIEERVNYVSSEGRRILEFAFLNAQTGEEGSCDSDYRFPYEIMVEGETEGALVDAGIRDFKVLNDQRQMKVIDNDQLPEVLGHRITFDSSGDVQFGCGAVTLSKEDVQIFVTVMEKLKGMKNYDTFMRICQEIDENEGFSAIDDIDLEDVKKILSVTK